VRPARVPAAGGERGGADARGESERVPEGVAGSEGEESAGRDLAEGCYGQGEVDVRAALLELGLLSLFLNLDGFGFWAGDFGPLCL